MLKYNKPCVYVIVCKDMRPRDIIVQASHAALESGIHQAHCEEYPSALVILQVANEQKLIRAKNYITKKGIKCQMFYEDPMERYTALASEVMNHDQRRAFRKFQLLSTYEPSIWEKFKKWLGL